MLLTAVRWPSCREGRRCLRLHCAAACSTRPVVGDVAPEVVISLLTTLPKWRPMRWRDFEPAQAIWGRSAQPGRRGQRAGVRRIVAESVIFAYGFASSVPPSIDESTPHFGAAPRGGSEMLAAIRAMEQTVLSSGEYSDMEGILLRYDALRRRCAAHRDDGAPRQVVGASGADG
jgi:hypothetical protein